MKKSNNYFGFFAGLADFMLLSFAFFIMYFWRRDELVLTPRYIKLLLVFYVTWFFVSHFIKKFKKDSHIGYFRVIFLYTKSVIFIVYGISLLVVLMGLRGFSRKQIFGTCIILFILEVISYTVYFLGWDWKKIRKLDESQRLTIEKSKISLVLFVSDLILITIAFYCLNFTNRGFFALTTEYEKILLVIYGLWLITSFITQKFDLRNFQNYYYAMAASIKAIIMMSFSMSVVIFALRLFYFSRLQIFGTFLLLIFLEAGVFLLYFFLSPGKYLQRGSKYIQKFSPLLEQKQLPIERVKRNNESSSLLMNTIKERIMEMNPLVQKLAAETIDISEFKASELVFMNSPGLSNVKLLEKQSLRLLVNMHRLNDVRRLNKHFLDIHKHLINGGYFIGTAVTIDTHRRQFFKKYPKYFAEFFSFFHFMFFRVFPKLPKLRKLYFMLTKGKNRMLSKAELLGRLYFCGFKVLNEFITHEGLYFVAQKVKSVSQDQSPSYGPLIKLKRVGLNGRMINVYKFRTMYPYSEYLQEYIYEQHKLEEGGKIREDFRITEWGKFFRKYWLDELPMLYNWIKGDLKIFGVRPLSKHYLSLYDSYLQRIRKMVKPGLIPPYYSDLPKKLEEINDSEKRYILAYCEHPLKTQFVYFWKALNNIFFKGARSG